MHTTRNGFLLLLTAFIWGFAFAFQTTGGAAVGPYTFTVLRSVIAFLVLIPAIALLDRLGLTKRKPITKADRVQLVRGGILCGLFLAATSIFQQVGLYSGVPAGKAGFLTACYIVLVPVLGLFAGKKCGWNVWLAIGIAICGLYLLCISESLSFQAADGLILLCSLACALHILMIDRFMLRVDVIRMSCIQFLTAAVIASIPMIVFEILPKGFTVWSGPLLQKDAWVSLLYVGVLSSGAAYTLQCIGQQELNPTVASLIMSLESVFSVLGGLILLNQRLTGRELAGCVLISAAVVFAQLPSEGKQKNAEN